MEPHDPEIPPIPPAPPTSLPPSPPPPELVRPNVPHVPLTPMMDFFQRRLEALERELVVEREKARSAQSQLQQQEALRGDVEGHLKAVSEQLRREKAEREAEEMKSHARGRIDSLEKRLDEMHQSWVALLKDAMTTREKGSNDIAASQRSLAHEQSVLSREQGSLVQEQASVKKEISELAAIISGLMEQVGQWRSEISAMTSLVPELKTLRTDLPEGSRRFEGEVAKMIADFSAGLRDRLAAWERRQEVESERQAERMRQLASEREALQRAWDENNHALRSELAREGMARERVLEDRIAELGQKFSDVILSQQKTATDAGRMRDDLSKAVVMMNTPPKAKDQIIAGLELERDDLVEALNSRTKDLQKFLDERRGIEKTLGNALTAMHAEVDAEREKLRQVSSRFTDLEFENAKLKDRISLHGQSLVEKDSQLAAMAGERDKLAKALVEESQRTRATIEERGLSEEDWRAKLAQAEKRITSEIEQRSKETTAASELRSQLAILTDHLSQAIQEKNAVSGRFGDWEGERQKLMATIRQKDEMISMLNAAFQNMLKKT